MVILVTLEAESSEVIMTGTIVLGVGWCNKPTGARAAWGPGLGAGAFGLGGWETAETVEAGAWDTPPTPPPPPR